MGPRATIEIGLNAAIVAVRETTPLILVVDGPDTPDMLPSGPFDPVGHRTMEMGLRNWVAEQTGLTLGYVEQLYTFGDRGRQPQPGDRGPFAVSVGYLALTQAGQHTPDEAPGPARWRDWYTYFPWEDWRAGRPPILDARVAPALDAWVAQAPETSGDEAAPSPARPLSRADRARVWFGREGRDWDEERVLERYELLYEAGLVAEAARDRPERVTVPAVADDAPPLGRAMAQDHRRILATAIGRLRAKLKYRPVIFELLPETFTLFELQRTVESLLGLHLHKQNFRRLVENRGLVQPTGGVQARTGGRPAKLYRFRRAVLHERPAPGLKV
ncbi:Predicted NAD regulator in Alphaproteobacteria [hydrothermal vent metagenome]|uniref:Predicted NAD regulator in Alphaproteobacteria n=1 Tax=hydrothermal vent metagenome TaxID=652676 RepID=A0A3B0TET0_9ZZZZ